MQRAAAHAERCPARREGSGARPARGRRRSPRSAAALIARAARSVQSRSPRRWRRGAARACPLRAGAIAAGPRFQNRRAAFGDPGAGCEQLRLEVRCGGEIFQRRRGLVRRAPAPRPRSPPGGSALPARPSAWPRPRPRAVRRRRAVRARRRGRGASFGRRRAPAFRHRGGFGCGLRGVGFVRSRSAAARAAAASRSRSPRRFFSARRARGRGGRFGGGGKAVPAPEVAFAGDQPLAGRERAAQARPVGLLDDADLAQAARRAGGRLDDVRERTRRRRAGADRPRPRRCRPSGREPRRRSRRRDRRPAPRRAPSRSPSRP